jgi:Uma2 family endonuclease
MKITSTEVKNSFGKYLRLCHSEPVYITKNGKTIAQLLNYTEKPNLVKDPSGAYNLRRNLMTYEEFTEMNEDAKERYEFIDGEVYMLSAPSVYHQRMVSRLHIALDRYLEGKPCDVFESPFDVTLLRKGDANRTNVVQPDLLVICDWEKDVNENERYMGIPRLLIEVLSPGNTVKEMITKLDLYRDSGVKEYWIVDTKRLQVIVYQFENYEITGTKIFKENESCRSFIYKEFEFEL